MIPPPPDEILKGLDDLDLLPLPEDDDFPSPPPLDEMLDIPPEAINENFKFPAPPVDYPPLNVPPPPPAPPAPPMAPPPPPMPSVMLPNISGSVSSINTYESIKVQIPEQHLWFSVLIF